MKDKFSYSKVMANYEDLRHERSEWETDYRQISDYLLPGRGIYQTYSKPRKRKLTSTRVINNAAEDALYVLTSGMHGGLTSPSRPWFKYRWTDRKLDEVEPLKMWLQECEEVTHRYLHSSNFYSVMNSFYIEYAGFGTGCMYVGEDSDTSSTPFRFELLTAGEYVFAVGAHGRPDMFFRTIFMTPRQLVEKFPDTVSKEVKKRVEKNEGGSDRQYVTVVEAIYKETHQDKPFTRVFYEVTSKSGPTPAAQEPRSQEPLEVSGFYEFPYLVSRWGTIGSDVYGIGPGSRAVPDIKRLQQMEKATLMAAHKALDPPINAPARMKNKLNTLPGGRNYYSNPAEVVSELYQVKFDFQGVGTSIERVEQRIQRNFFNDIFLTAARDPNATPYKATEVNAREQEKMLRLGPVIERLGHEFLQPLIERVFNILMRRDLLPPLSPELAEMAGDYDISLVSPLATAQRAVALQGIQSFLGFIGQAAQFDQGVLDNVDIDEAVRDYADITGVSLGVLRQKEEVQQMRQQRAQAQAAEKQKQEQMQMADLQGQLDVNKATASKTQSEAGLNLLEGQQVQQDMGMV
jgi:hypothetical protein